MIIVRTPYRVSFFGGGTDYANWYEKHCGQVLTCSLNKYCYISARKMPPFLGTKYRIFWSHMEAVDNRDDIKHSGVRGCLEALGIDEGVEVNHAGDLPARSGLGSSSAFTVGMLNALYAMHGRIATTRSLAMEAIHVEQEVLKETVGVQDQIECAHGGFNHIQINKQGGYTLSPIYIPHGLEKRLMLFFTGIQRHASEVADAQVANADRKETELQEISSMVPAAIECLQKQNLDGFGELLHHSWMLKKTLSDRISNETFDQIYEWARAAGAIGGKMLGAGGGGFFLFYVDQERQNDVRNALRDLIEVPFKFGTNGSQIVVNEP